MMKARPKLYDLGIPLYVPDVREKGRYVLRLKLILVPNDKATIAF